MNSNTLKRKSNLIALDIAMLLLGSLVMLLVLKLLRFDDPNPMHNAWLYLLGVPTALISISMLTRVLTNDFVEKSIQVGFLISVGLHLFLMLAAINVVLFPQQWPTNIEQVALVAASIKPKAPQFFEPRENKPQDRPDYLKPVSTAPNSADESSQPQHVSQASIQPDINVAKDAIIPNVSERAFNKKRREAAPSQPSIESSAEQLDRPDLTKQIEQPSNPIDVSNAPANQPTPLRELQAAQTDTPRSAIGDAESRLIEPMLQTDLKADQLSMIGTLNGALKKPDLQDARQIDRAVDRSLAKSADLPDRPSPLQQPKRVDNTSPTLSSVPVPKLGTSAPNAPVERPIERPMQTQSKSKESQRAGGGPTDPTQLGQPSRIEPSFGRGIPIPMRNSGTQPNSPTSLPNDNSFLNDPRFAINDDRSQRKVDRASFAPSQSTAPASNQPIAIHSPSNSRDSTQAAASDDLDAVLAAGVPGKSDLERTRSSKSANQSDRSTKSSLNAELGSAKAVGGPTIDKPNNSSSAAVRDLAKRGPDIAKRDFAMPEIRDAELTTDRFKRPETGGPQIARSAVPIPAPAFSQRLNRNTDLADDSAADLGPLGPQTEAAIELGLQFLAKHQRDDGSWRLEDFGERVDMRSDAAATALALLSFQGAGYTHKQFKYADICKRAIDWLVEHQRPNGDLYARGDTKSDANAWLYSHAIATLAVCESYGMTQDENIKDSAQRAIDFLVASQDPQAGGWRYQPRIGSDTSVTGWCMMALKSAELSGLKVPKESYSGIAKWLNASQASDQQRFLYRYNWQAADAPSTRHGRIPTPVMTSVGLLMRLYLGWRRTNPDMIQGTDWLLERLPAEGTATNPQRDTYYWYYATQVLFHMGADRWKIWYESLYPMLIQSQRKNGEFVGSWDPNGKIPDAWGRFGGRLYVTTLNLLSLEVYYRHLPIYEAAAD